MIFRETSAEIKMLSETVHRIALKELKERVEADDHYPDVSFMEEPVVRAQREGLTIVCPPVEAGGMGSLAALGAVLFETAQVHASLAAVLLTHAAVQEMAFRSGNESAAAKTMAESQLNAFPLYEEESEWGVGVEAGTGKKRDVLLNGRLKFVPLAPVAENILIAARIKGEPLVALVAADSRGLTVGEPLVTLGLRACPVADIELQDVRARREEILARGETASRLIHETYLRLLGLTTALSAGIARGSYLEARYYAEQRYQGGAEIINHQQVRRMLADMAGDAALAEQLAVEQCLAADEGRELEASWYRAGFIRSSDAVARAAMDGVQLLGGYGYMQDYGQERRMRDAKQAQLILGRNDLHRLQLMNELEQINS